MIKSSLVVGIGASAGGLEALSTFFRAMPNNSNMAFIVVVHLDPSHISLLPELLQRQTKMKVMAISDGRVIEPNNIYVIPPNYNVSILNQQLHLVAPLNLHAKLPIDFFFRSLAQDLGRNAVGIILSGTGSDGTAGLREIKAEDGLVIVQSIDSAKYDGMPQNAIATKLVDFVAAPEDMPKQLLHYSQQRLDNAVDDKVDIEDSNRILSKILALIYQQTGHDFSFYKKNTIFRRIERRMQVHQIESLKNYLEFVQINTQEIAILFNELLIGVTSFFRDREAFDALKRLLVARLESKPDDYIFRIWVPGCSTGEEAYSIAIMFQDCLTSIGRAIGVQIFATDIDEYAISHARLGRYPLSIAADIGEEYCQRYFNKENDQYHIKPIIRDSLVFATQNLIKDPPFTKLDLISCRNLLIYFGPELQKRVLPAFHYALKEDGILFLGPSETTGQSNKYFEILEKKWKIFKRKLLSDETNNGLYFSAPTRPFKMEENPILSTISQIEELSALQLVETILRQSKVPPCVVIDSALNIVYVHGRLGHYLEPAEGRVSSNILEMSRSLTLKNELNTVIHKVMLHKKDVCKKAIAVEIDGHNSIIDLTVKPLQDIGSLKGLMMVSFDNVVSPLKEQENNKTESTRLHQNKDAHALEKELENTRESLQTTIEELETSNEELKSSNEELQSTNEELQSTNEELETSKEELQSLNEESVTVNAELQSHIEELSTANDDIKNLLDSTQIATLFLDPQLKIRRYTPTMTNIINLVSTDIDRPIGHLATSLIDIKLADYADKVLATLEKIECEVFDDNNKCYRMRVLPYRTTNNVIAGVVISFQDITYLKHTETALRLGEQRYKSLFDHCPVAIVEMDVSALASYITQNKLTTVAKLKKHWSQGDHIKQIAGLIKPLNVNEAGQFLFRSNSKEKLLKSIPRLVADDEGYLYQQMIQIIEKKDAFTCDSQIETTDGNRLLCNITITVPRIDNELNFSNTVIVLTPR